MYATIHRAWAVTTRTLVFAERAEILGAQDARVLMKI